MPPARRRPPSTPDPTALANLSSDAPRLTRTADVDPVLGAGTRTPATPAPAAQPQPAAKAAPTTEKFAGYISTEVADQVRDAVVALGGSWTIGSLLEEALTREVKRLAKEHNDGQPFPARSSRQLRRGRRIQ